MENSSPLTRAEMVELSELARGFYGKPEPQSLLVCLAKLDPAVPEDRKKLAELKTAHDELKNPVECLRVRSRVRALLGLPQSYEQDEDEWHYYHPGLM